VLLVARECVGKWLVHETPAGPLGGTIVEAEAYRGPEDRAAHSYGGRRTKRTEAMFGEAGHAYLFFVYGMHWNFNVVAGQAGQPHAVLIRAISPELGVEAMQRLRGRHKPSELSNGPGKLCQALGLDGRHYGLDLCGSSLYLADAAPRKVARARRVGIDYAGAWAEKLWRFYDPASVHISRPKPARAKPGKAGPVPARPARTKLTR
jgi:DNA-3-methyladenine glycosylase